jgi:Domain of unknown function (DUF4352)
MRGPDGPSIDCASLILSSRSKSPRLRTGGPAGHRRGVLAAILCTVLLVVFAVFVGLVKLGPTPSPVEQVRVLKVWQDTVDAPAGMAYYLLDVNASNSGPDPWPLDPSLFSLTTNGSLAFHPSLNYAWIDLLSNSTVLPDGSATGEVAFELPAAQSPSVLKYADPAGREVAQTSDIPAVSGIATRFDPSVHFVLTGTSWAATVETWAAIINQSSGLAYFGGEPVDRNNTFLFFTGQGIGVTFFFDYFKRPSDPTTISVQSITNDDGFPVSDVMAMQTQFGFTGYSTPHPLPVNMTGYGANASVTLLVNVPAGHQDGVLHFTVQFSG